MSSDPLETPTFSENIGLVIRKLWRNILRLDDRTPPLPEDGYYIIETWPYNRDGSLGWSRVASGSVNDYVAGGELIIQSGIDTNGYVLKKTGYFILGGGSFKVTGSVKGDAYESGQDIVITFGVGAQSNSDLRVNPDGLNWVVDTANLGTNWAITSNAGSSEYVLVADTGIPYDANERLFEISADESGTAVVFKTKLTTESDWTAVHVETTNLPTQSFGARVAFAKTAGTTSKNMRFGRVGMRYERPTI